RAAGYGEAVRHSATIDTDLLYLARRLDRGSSELGFLRLAVPLYQLRAVERHYTWLVRGAVGAACVLLFAVGAAAARRMTEPLQRVTDAALAVAGGDVGREPPDEGPREVLELSAALRRMKTSLLDSVRRSQSERRFVEAVFDALPLGIVAVDE